MCRWLLLRDHAVWSKNKTPDLRNGPGCESENDQLCWDHGDSSQAFSLLKSRESDSKEDLLVPAEGRFEEFEAVFDAEHERHATKLGTASCPVWKSWLAPNGSSSGGGGCG